MKSKEVLVIEAAERMEISNTMTISQKIARLDKGNFAAKKERKRLNKEK